MPLNFTYLKKLAKDFAIEGTAVAIAFAVDTLIAKSEDESESPIFRSAFALRVYYLSKNILNYIDVKLSGSSDKKHMYAGLFNTGVACSLYPATKFFPLEAAAGNAMIASGIVFFSGITLRALIEIVLEKQTPKEHLKLHAGNLIVGSTGILFSRIPKTAIASPSFYWTGDFIDLLRHQQEPWKEIVLSPKSTVQLQVFAAYSIKTGLNFANVTLPLPGYIIDSLLGTSHRLLVHTRMHLNSEPQPVAPAATDQTVNVQVATAMPVDEKKLEPSPRALKWLMTNTATTVFQTQPQKVPSIPEPSASPKRTNNIAA